METVSIRLLKVLKGLILPRVERMLQYPSGFNAPDIAFLHLVRARLLAGYALERDQRTEFFHLYRRWETV